MINTRELKAAMAREGLTQTKLAELMGIAPSSLSMKLKNSTFKYSELITMVGILHLENPGAIFFADAYTEMVN